MTLFEWVIAIMLLFGTVFILGASLGLIRLPDIYLQLSAATKAATLGVGFLLLATAVHFQEAGVTSRVIGYNLISFTNCTCSSAPSGSGSLFCGSATS